MRSSGPIILSLEGSREVKPELLHGPKDTPARRRMVKLIREIEAIKERRSHGMKEE